MQCSFSVNGERDFRIDFLRFSEASVVDCVSDCRGLSWPCPAKTKVPFLSFTSHVICPVYYFVLDYRLVIIG